MYMKQVISTDSFSIGLEGSVEEINEALTYALSALKIFNDDVDCTEPLECECPGCPYDDNCGMMEEDVEENENQEDLQINNKNVEAEVIDILNFITETFGGITH